MDEKMIGDSINGLGLEIQELRKNLDAFVTDTGTAFFNAGTEIAELKQKVGAYRSYQNNCGYTTKLDKQLGELKEEIKANEKICNLGYQECIKHFNTSFEKYDNLEGLLRDLFIELKGACVYDWNGKEIKITLQHNIGSLLAKLDGEKTEKNKGVDWSASVALELKEKIEELEKQLDSLFNSVRFQRIEKIEKVIYELMRALWIRKNISDGTYKELKEELDASKTECKHESDLIVCEKCAHPDIIAMVNKMEKKASGGVMELKLNEPMGERVEGIAKVSLPDSKLPKCKFYFEEHCEPCKSPTDFNKCDLVKIGMQIVLKNFIENIPEPIEKKPPIQCPKCSSKALTVGGSTSTLLHIPTETDENGNIIIPEIKNTITTSYHCKKCGHSFEETD